MPPRPSGLMGRLPELTLVAYSLKSRYSGFLYQLSQLSHEGNWSCMAKGAGGWCEAKGSTEDQQVEAGLTNGRFHVCTKRYRERAEKQREKKEECSNGEGQGESQLSIRSANVKFGEVRNSLAPAPATHRRRGDEEEDSTQPDASLAETAGYLSCCGRLWVGAVWAAAVLVHLPFAWTPATNAAKSETRSRAGTSVPLQPCRHPMTDGPDRRVLGHPAGGSREDWPQIRLWRSGGPAES